MASPNEGWAVGGTGPSSYGVIMHYTNTTWSRVSVPTDTFTVNAVTMISPTEGWVAGYVACSYGECNRGQLMHYTAATGWQTVTVPAKPGAGVWGGLYGIDIKGTTGWIVSNNYHLSGSPSFLQFDGTNWTPVSAPFLNYNGVSIVNANDAWAVANNFGFNSSGIASLAHYSGGSWSEVTSTVSAAGTVYMQGIHMLSASDGWAAGYAGYTFSGYQCVLLHYNGSNWSQVPCPAEASDVQLASVYMRSSNDVWAVGNQYGWAAGNRYILSQRGPGVILHYDGSAWTRSTAPPETPALRSIKLVGSDDGWIVGWDGTILRLVGGNWTRVQGSSLFVGPVDSVSANEAWYGGANGEWLQWKNGVVLSHTSGMTLPIAALDMLSPTVGWSGTNLRSSNYIAKFADGSWTITPTYSTRVYGISMLGPEEGWFATSTGLLHYSSGAWQTYNIYNGAYSVSMLDADHGWAVSRQWGVYTYTNGVWTPFSIPVSGDYREIKVIGITPDEAWIAGWSLACNVVGCPVTPRLLHFTNNAWQPITMTNWLAFLDISKASATEWWAAGKLTTMEYAFLHYKDGTYTVVPAAGEDVIGVSMLPDGAGFARGVGSLLQLNTLTNQVYLPIVIK